jgi:lambda family phage portal protein
MKIQTLFKPGELASFYWPDTAYSGASSERKELANWQPMIQPPDAELLPELGTLVARSRDLDRNHGIASSGFQTLVDNIVGTGLRLASMPDYRALKRDIKWAEEWSRGVEAQWKVFAESLDFDVARQLDFDGATAMMFRTVALSGECLALPLWIEDKGSKFATTFQLVEGDRLSNPDYRSDTERLRGGIEIDDYGKPLAYYLRKSLPGTWPIPGFYMMPGTWERIPAITEWGRKRVLHLYTKDRINQSRGKPILTSVLEQFKMFDHYQRTELQSSIVNALVAGVIETPLDQAQIAAMMGDDANKYLAMKNEWRTSLRGGAMIPLYPGDKMTPFTPARPASQYANFVETVLRHISAAMNMPYELLIKDFSKTNYSSARASLLEAWRFFNSRRKWLSKYWANQVYQLWLEEAVNKKLVDAPKFYDNFAFYARCKWIGSGRGWIDPVKEAQAAAVRLQTKISTLEMECAEQGNDWQDVLEQTALERARMKQLGIYDDPLAMQGKPANGKAPSKGGGGTPKTKTDKGTGVQQDKDPDPHGEDYT